MTKIYRIIYNEDFVMKKIFGSKQIAALLLALLILLPVFVGCAETETPEVTTEADNGAATTVGDSVPEQTTRDTLPELNYGGETVHVLYWKDANNNEFYVEKQDGTPINDVVYKRNANVEKRLGITIGWNGQNGAKGKLNSFVTYIRTNVDAGNDIEVVAAHSMVMGAIAAEGYMQDLNSVEHINLDSPWWPKDLVENSTIHDSTYFVSGDISLNTLLGMEGLFFNKDMTESNLYSYVQNKTWTIDQMIIETQNSYKDTTGDGKTEDDTFGYVTYSGMINAIVIGMGIRITDKDDEGKIIFSETYASEKTQSILEKINETLFKDNNWYYASKWDKAAEIFSAGNALFCMASVRYTTNELADSAVTYGILPAPLYDKNQTDYYTLMANTYTMYGIAEGVENTEMHGAFIEAMASEGYYTVTPAVFEIALKTRYSDDSQDAMMFDVLRESVVMEIGLVFSDQIDGIPSKALFTMVDNKSADWISYIRSKQTKINAALDKLNDSFDK